MLSPHACCPALHRPLQHLRTTLPKPFESLNTNVAKLCGHACWTVLAYFYFTMRLRSIQGTATSASRGAECATFGARNAAPRRQRHLDKRSNTAISAFSATAAPFDRMQPPAKPASETVVSVEFQCPAGSLAARLLRHHPLAVLQTAAHEESALLSQLAGRLHAASILAGGLLLTATQHDTCIAKLGLMQAVAVAAGVSRYVAALRRSAAPTAASLDLRGAKELGEEAGSCCHRHSHAGEALESQLHIQEQAATGPYRIRWSSQLPSSPTHTGSATDTHGGPQAAAGAPTPALQDVSLREPNGAPAGPRAVPRAPQGIWTSLRPQQLPQVAAHAVRLEAMRRALARVAAERGVEEEPGARDGETGGGHREQGGGVRSHSCAGVELEHVGVCSCCWRWAMAWKLAVAGARIAAALAVAAALWAVLGGEAAWTRFTRGLMAPV